MLNNYGLTIDHFLVSDPGETNPLFPQCIWVIGQARGQDGCILAKFFFCMFMDLCSEQAWAIKDTLYGIKHQKNDLLLFVRKV